MKDRKLRQQALYDSLASRIVVLDGAMGSILHSQLTVEDYGGSHLENCTDNVCLTRPDLIADIHKQYLDAGAQLIETNSFNGHPLSMAEFHLRDKTEEINHAAARIAREAADEYWSDAKPRFVAGSMGPTTRSITVTRNVTFEDLRDGYYMHAMLAKGMQHLNCGHARRMNRKHGRTGHLFRNHYSWWPVETDEHLNEAVRYIVLNPVRAGICTKPEQWPWSSYRAAADLELPADFLALSDLLGIFGIYPGRPPPLAAFRDFVAAGQRPGVGHLAVGQRDLRVAGKAVRLAPSGDGLIVEAVSGEQECLMVAQQGPHLAAGGRCLGGQPSNVVDDADAVRAAIDVVAEEPQPRLAARPAVRVVHQAGLAQRPAQLVAMAVNVGDDVQRSRLSVRPHPLIASMALSAMLPGVPHGGRSVATPDDRQVIRCAEVESPVTVACGGLRLPRSGKWGFGHTLG